MVRELFQYCLKLSENQDLINQDCLKQMKLFYIILINFVFYYFNNLGM
jgi:hypothetical protein